MSLAPDVGASPVGQSHRWPSSRFHVYVYGVIVVGAVSAAVVLAQPGQWAETESRQWLVVGIMSVALVVGELRPIPISRGGDNTDYITISTTFAVALVILGPVGVAIIAQCLAVVLDYFPNRSRPRNLLFNVSQYALTVMAARGVYGLVAGVPFSGPFQSFNPSDVRCLTASFLAGLTFLVVNHALISTVVALQHGFAVWGVVVADIKFQSLTSAVLVSMGPMAALVVETQWLMLPLLGAPLIAVYRSAELAVDRERQAKHDNLTGLANRELFRERSVPALHHAQRSDQKLAIMMIDLDHFKNINDTLGHQVGDELIIEVARRIDEAKPVGATVARLGGDEFAVLLPDVPDLSVAEDVATYLLSVLSKSFAAGGVRLAVQGSIGISIAPDHGDDVHTLMKCADIALYEAKRERARYFTYRPEDDVVNTPQRLSLVAELLSAVDDGQFFLEYQPKLDLMTGGIVGVEALVRWNHPTRGIMRPDDFIPLAESTGLISPITWFVIDRALCQVREWNTLGHDVSMAINLSVRHLTDMSLPDRIAIALSRWQVAPDRLVIEVTESSVMTDPKRAIGVIQHLRRLGVSVAVDDYGTGQTSLAYLRRLDIDELKIDRSFMMKLDKASSDAIIVRSTIELGHNLGLRIVAEGIEDAATLAWLADLGCDIGQGYHIGRPMNAEAVGVLIADGVPVWRGAARGSAPEPPEAVDDPAGRLRLVEQG
jgi:diguanylate cyclase (GGDEF)-like protein